ncbi:MAG: hypothetical protein D6696_04345 [Acidobacteria bacterium]|nr:MAG: hypothetical protein D6696_04345 [Acidobacteriota bacterium]
MTELARSLMRLSWALSMLGAGQARRLLDPQAGWGEAAADLDAVSHAAEGRLEEPVRGLFELGERLQGSVADGLAGASGPLAPMTDAAKELLRRATSQS